MLLRLSLNVEQIKAAARDAMICGFTRHDPSKPWTEEEITAAVQMMLNMVWPQVPEKERVL